MKRFPVVRLVSLSVAAAALLAGCGGQAEPSEEELAACTEALAAAQSAEAVHYTDIQMMGGRGVGRGDHVQRSLAGRRGSLRKKADDGGRGNQLLHRWKRLGDCPGRRHRDNGGRYQQSQLAALV